MLPQKDTIKSQDCLSHLIPWVDLEGDSLAAIRGDWGAVSAGGWTEAEHQMHLERAAT